MSNQDILFSLIMIIGFIIGSIYFYSKKIEQEKLRNTIDKLLDTPKENNNGN